MFVLFWAMPEFHSADLTELRKAINSTQDYVDRIQLKATPDHYHLKQLINLVHSLDHMQRLYERCEEVGLKRLNPYQH